MEVGKAKLEYCKMKTANMRPEYCEKDGNLQNGNWRNKNLEKRKKK